MLLRERSQPLAHAAKRARQGTHDARPNAVAQSRRLKPSIPLTGCYHIPIRDEIELVRTL